jgi:hypothetical protein
MFLRNILLENVRSLESCELSFDGADGGPRRRTLLLGENGTGGTTILRSIALLLAGGDALAELVPIPDRWIRAGRKSCRMVATVMDESGRSHQLEIGIKKGDDTGTMVRRNRPSLEALGNESRRGYLTVGYGISRRSNSDAGGTPPGEIYTDARARSVGSLFSSESVLHPLEEWALDFDARIKSGGAVVRELLADLLPGAPLHAIDRRNGRLTFRTPDGILPLEQLSDGYRSVAAWIGDLLYRITETLDDPRRPMRAHGLLLVDEIELHMHPLWQRRFLLYLEERFPNLQIVATTNSPLIAHQARSGEIFVLRRDSADAAPIPQRYEGDPSRMMIHQLLASPLFGLDTVDSAPVEQLRMEHRALKSQPAAALSSSERRRAKELAEEIRDLPRWNSGTPGDSEKRALLESIEKAIRKQHPK